MCNNQIVPVGVAGLVGVVVVLRCMCNDPFLSLAMAELMVVVSGCVCNDLFAPDGVAALVEVRISSTVGSTVGVLTQ